MKIDEGRLSFLVGYSMVIFSPKFSDKRRD